MAQENAGDLIDFEAVRRKRTPKFGDKIAELEKSLPNTFEQQHQMEEEVSKRIEQIAMDADRPFRSDRLRLAPLLKNYMEGIPVFQIVCMTANPIGVEPDEKADHELAIKYVREKRARLLAVLQNALSEVRKLEAECDAKKWPVGSSWRRYTGIGYFQTEIEDCLKIVRNINSEHASLDIDDLAQLAGMRAAEELYAAIEREEAKYTHRLVSGYGEKQSEFAAGLFDFLADMFSMAMDMLDPEAKAAIGDSIKNDDVGRLKENLRGIFHIKDPVDDDSKEGKKRKQEELKKKAAKAAKAKARKKAMSDIKNRFKQFRKFAKDPSGWAKGKKRDWDRRKSARRAGFNPNSKAGQGFADDAEAAKAAHNGQKTGSKSSYDWYHWTAPDQAFKLSNGQTTLDMKNGGAFGLKQVSNYYLLYRHGMRHPIRLNGQDAKKILGDSKPYQHAGAKTSGKSGKSNGPKSGKSTGGKTKAGKQGQQSQQAKQPTPGPNSPQAQQGQQSKAPPQGQAQPAAPQQPQPKPKVQQPHPEHDDAVSALKHLGYKEKDADEAVKQATADLGPDAKFEDLVKRSIKKFYRSGKDDQDAQAEKIKDESRPVAEPNNEGIGPGLTTPNGLPNPELLKPKGKPPHNGKGAKTKKRRPKKNRRVKKAGALPLD